ncbi:MAG TPA: hypothetical protein PK530_01765 [Anaerolineales bacterium]|nr:hypothetical protein [Anaerolineales bacterium]
MLQISEIDFPGYKAQSTLGTFFQHETPANHLAVIFPGYGYTCDRALLHYPMQMLLAQGADVLQVKYEFSNKPGFWQSGDQTRALWFGTDALAAMRTVLAKGDYQQITMVGKSLGTVAVGHVATILPHLAQLRGVMLTPLLKNPGLVQQIKSFNGELMLVVGTGDSLHDPAVMEEVRAVRKVEVMEVDGGDHSLENKEDVMGSLDTLKWIMQGVKDFLE